MVERLRPYVDAGASHIVFLSLDPPEAIPDVVRALNEEVKPALS